MALTPLAIRRRLAVIGALMVVSAVVLPGLAPAAPGTIPYRWKSCTIVNKRFPHGVGRVGAHDRTKSDPVTNFRRSTRLYKEAMRYHPGLDRDKDGIACEKH